MVILPVYDYRCIQYIECHPLILVYGKAIVSCHLNTSAFFTVFFTSFQVNLLFFTAFTI